MTHLLAGLALWAWAHALTLTGIAAVWVLTLLAKPFGRCWLCWGHGNIRRKGSRRAPVCPLCHGHGRRQRTGSKVVHRVRKRVMAEIRRTRAERARQGNPS
jgi:hypothetical protein